MTQRPMPALRNALLAALALAVALPPGAAGAERPRVRLLRRTVVVGDSLLGGIVSGGLVRRDQKRTASRLLARQAGVRLPQPYMSNGGLPPPLRIIDRNGNGRLDAGEVRRGTVDVGFRRRPEQPVRNLAIAGEDMRSIFERPSVGTVLADIVAGDVDGRDVLKLLILGLPPQDRPLSQLARARALHPTFLMVWLGSNEILGMATRTRPDVARMTPAEFGVAFRDVLNRLAVTGADMAVANLPDVTRIASLRRPAGEVTECRGPDGTVEPVADDALLSIALDPAKLPVPSCTNVLDPAEQEIVRETVVAFDDEIAAAVADVEASRGVRIALVDMLGLFDDVAQHGYPLGDGRTLTTQYLGGVFSLDGVHPSRTGHALIANAFIDAINARFGEAIPRVDVARVAAHDPLVGSRFRSDGPPPFGVVADVNVEVEDALDAALDRVAASTGDILGDLLDSLGDHLAGLFRF